MDTPTGAVFIGPFPRGGNIVSDYYAFCAQETIGPTTSFQLQTPVRIPVVATERFDTFDELVAKLLNRTEWVRIIACHGNPEHGLIVPFAHGGKTATGEVMYDLGSLALEYKRLADRHQCLDPDNPAYAPRVKSISALMNVKPDVVARVAENLGKLQSGKCIIEIRGCNLGKEDPTGMVDLLSNYRRAFGHMTSAPTCRMMYLGITPARPGFVRTGHGRPQRDTVFAMRASSPGHQGGRSRRRFLPASPVAPQAGGIIIDAVDYDGHAQVEGFGFLDDPRRTVDWANRILMHWQQPRVDNRFVVPVMWDDSEGSFDLPLEPRWSSRLRMLPALNPG